MGCARCQTPAIPDAAFCDECGARLETMCRACHQPNRTEAKFCRHCGAPASEAASTAPPRRDVASPPTVSPIRAAAPRSYTPPHLAARILTTRSALEGERKQVTVLFADVENFTGLGEELDPEELHVLMDRVFATLLDTVHRYEGTVNQFTGDGVMALFGAPVAIENHALQAVEAALEVQTAMAAAADEFRARWGRAPVLRIGLNTGRVVVGKIGDDLRMDYTAQGDTVNLAARLQAVAAPGTVAISEATRRVVADDVKCESLGLHTVKGRATPLQVWRPLRIVHQRSRISVEADETLSPLVGRELELARLLELFEAVRDGRVRSAVVTGEAGVGKSRLLLEFRQRIRDTRFRWFEGHCVPYGRSTPYRSIVEIVRTSFGLHDGDSEELAASKLDKLVSEFGAEGRQIAPALRHLLALGPTDAEMALLSPADRKAAITRALDVLMQRQNAEPVPHVFVVEDGQWIDSASDEYFARVSREMVSGPLLFLFTQRPDESGRGGVTASGTRIDLRPLVPSQAHALILHLAGGRRLPDDVLSLAVDRTGGNPMFIEELTRTLVEDETVEIPPTIADVLTARIDRLAPMAKSTLQVASVIGREFSLRLLERVTDGVPDVGEAVAMLASLGLVVPRDSTPGWFAFRHGLLQETAYEGLLHQRRKVLHRATGEALEELYADRLPDHVDALARHFLRADEWERAAFYLREAGRKAAALCANTEAVQRFERALEVQARLPETLERSRDAIDLRLDLRSPLLQLGRLDDVLRLSREAESLAQVLGDERRLARVYSYLINYHYLKGQPDIAIEYGARCLPVADRPDVPGIDRTARQYLARRRGDAPAHRGGTGER